MDLVSASDVTTLMEARGPALVSIYLETARAGAGIKQGPIRLKNALREARDGIAALGLRDEALLGEIGPLVDDNAFWQHQEDGLALFAGPAGTRILRLPQTFEPLVVVGERFHVKPLLPVMSRGERFHLLALSANEVRLFGGTRFGVTPIQLPADVPQSLADALWFEDPEAQLQFRQAARTPTGIAAIFHGHGGGKDQPQEEIERFFRAVAGGLSTVLETGVPLVLAGVESHAPIFRRVSGHDPIMSDEVLGNPERLDDQTLHRRAWEIVEPYFAGEREAAREALIEGSGPRALTLEEAVAAAASARVAAAFVAGDVEVWGRVGDDGAALVHEERQPGDRDLLDHVVSEAWTKGGANVWVVGRGDVPGGGVVAALLRY